MAKPTATKSGSEIQHQAGEVMQMQVKKPSFKSRVPVTLMTPDESSGVRIPPSGVWEIRNDCSTRKFKHVTDEISGELTILPIAVSFGYGLIPPFSTAGQVFKAFTDPNSRKPVGYNKDWFKFDDTNKVVGVNNLKGIIEGIFSEYTKEWVYAWFIPLDNFGAKLPENVLCGMPCKSGSIFGANGIINYLDFISANGKSLFQSPVELEFGVTHNNPQGGDVYGVEFYPCDEDKIASYQPKIDLVKEWLQSGKAEFPIPEALEQMVFRGSYSELQEDHQQGLLQSELLTILYQQLTGEPMPSSLDGDLGEVQPLITGSESHELSEMQPLLTQGE
jgi:hypothetical protein